MFVCPSVDQPQPVYWILFPFPTNYLLSRRMNAVIEDLDVEIHTDRKLQCIDFCFVFVIGLLT